MTDTLATLTERYAKWNVDMSSSSTAFAIALNSASVIGDAAGYRRGLEAAARVCRERAGVASSEDGFVVALSCASEIEALIPDTEGSDV